MTGLSSFTIDDLEHTSRDLRALSDGCASMQEAAQRITDDLFERLRGSGRRAECAAISLHKTHPYRALPLDLHALVRSSDASVRDDHLCLTAMSNAADEPAAGALLQAPWPLTAATSDAQPVLAALLSAMGIELSSLPDPISAIRTGAHRQLLEGFHVQSVQSSPLIDGVARESLHAAGVSSAVGLGGGLPSGNLFVVFVLGRVPIGERRSRLLRSLASAIRASLTPFTHRPFPSEST